MHLFWNSEQRGMAPDNIYLKGWVARICHKSIVTALKPAGGERVSHTFLGLYWHTNDVQYCPLCTKLMITSLKLMKECWLKARFWWEKPSILLNSLLVMFQVLIDIMRHLINYVSNLVGIIITMMFDWWILEGPANCKLFRVQTIKTSATITYVQGV